MASDYEVLWNSYQESVNRLYRAGPGEADRSAAMLDEEAGAEVDTLVETSAALRQSLVAHLDDDEDEVRELAAWKLLASASYDLAVAGDLLAVAQAGPEAEPDRSVRTSMALDQDLRNVLDAPLDKSGMAQLVEADRGFLLERMPDARDTLLETIDEFVDAIPQNAAELCQSAVGAALPLRKDKPLLKVLNMAGGEILKHVPDNVALTVKRAARLLAEMVQKLLSLLDTEITEKLNQKIQEWLEKIPKEGETGMVTGWLNQLYETERIHEEVRERVDHKGDEPRPYNEDTRKLQELMARNEKRKKLVEKLFWATGFVEAGLLKAVPWGPVALYTAYAAILGYAVYSGGDYLDWYRTGHQAALDRVRGLRSSVTL